jgi:hypothetical protein
MVATEKDRYNLIIRVFEPGEDYGRRKIVYNTSVLITKRNSRNLPVEMRLLHATEQSYSWKPNPASYLEISMGDKPGVLLFNPVSRMAEFQAAKSPGKINIKTANGEEFSEGHVFNAMVRYFLRSYRKALAM